MIPNYLEQDREMREHKVKVLLQDPKALAKDRLIKFAEMFGHNYDAMMKHTAAVAKEGTAWNTGSYQDDHFSDSMWEAFETVTNTTVPLAHRFHQEFRCAC